jgi:hypothetical protein
VTEDEAKTKACCAAMHGEPKGSTLALKAPACIASECMAWRTTQGGEGSTITHVDQPPTGLGWEIVGEPWNADPNGLLTGPAILQRWRRDLPIEGFCGLAGSPQ